MGSRPQKQKSEGQKTLRFFVVEVTGLEPSSSRSAAFSRRPGRAAPACALRSSSSRKSRFAAISGSPVKGKRSWVRVRKNKKAKGKTLRFFVVEVTGLEPTTSWSRTKRATKLRYTSKNQCALPNCAAPRLSLLYANRQLIYYSKAVFFCQSFVPPIILCFVIFMQRQGLPFFRRYDKILRG